MKTNFYEEIADCGNAVERIKTNQNLMLDLYNTNRDNNERITEIAALLAESQRLMDEYDQLAKDYENLMSEVNS